MTDSNFSAKATKISEDLILFENKYNNFSFPKHFHETFLIEIIERGTEKFYSNGSNYTNVKCDTLVLINPGGIHTGGGGSINDAELVCKVFYPELDAWKKIIGESFSISNDLSSLRFKPSVVHDNLIANNIKALFSLSQHDPNSLLLKEIYHQVMFDLLSRHMSSTISLDENYKKYASAIKRSVDYINDQLSDKLLLDDIARTAFISPFHFLRVFKKFTGITLHQYILSLRIERAKVLLRQKNTIGITLSKTGFLDQAHFTKVFKKITGLTPKQFKDAVKD